MVLSKLQILQNFCEITQVSQSQVLCRCQHLGVSNFCKVVSDYRSWSRILKGKKSWARKEKCQSCQVSLYNLTPLISSDRNISVSKKCPVIDDHVMIFLST